MLVYLSVGHRGVCRNNPRRTETMKLILAAAILVVCSFFVQAGEPIPIASVTGAGRNRRRHQ
jgi:hypothetical protein